MSFTNHGRPPSRISEIEQLAVFYDMIAAKHQARRHLASQIETYGGIGPGIGLHVDVTAACSAQL